MIFARKINYNFDSVKVHIDDKEVIKVSSTRFLGILIDEKLAWKEHISFVCYKVKKKAQYNAAVLRGDGEKEGLGSPSPW